MTRLKASIHGAVLAVGVAVLLLGCEKEEEITGPLGPGLKPTNAVVTVEKPAILSAGRDSSLWRVKLFQAGVPFTSVYTVNMLTDRHGSFLKDGKREKQVAFQTDANGEASLYFYGSSEPGVSVTRVWGDGFGVDTVTVSVIVGYPYYVRLAFADAQEQFWKDTDTLKSGGRFTRPDSTLVRATVLDLNQNPVEGISVDLVPYVNSSPIRSAQYGYFKSAPSPAAKSDGRAVTDALGNASDLYYSDILPFTGNPADVEIVALADSSAFGRISTRKFITIRVP